MGLFNRDKKELVELDSFNLHQPTLEQQTENMKATAIEYIVNLGKADKDKFFESVELIWQGYQIMDGIKTKHQKAIYREARQAGVDEKDEDFLDLLADEPPAPKTKDVKKVEVKQLC